MPELHWFVTEIDPKNAGYRVRTMPIVAELKAQGISVELHATGELASEVKSLAGTAAVVVVSKPADSLTFLCLSHLRASGVPVVIDLFDNYFSWSPALHRRQLHWQWLSALQAASLVVVSSDFLGHVVRSLTAKPVVEIADLVLPPLAGRLDAPALAAKWREPERIELLWFGIAGNPYYPAGLEDLARWTRTIRRLILDTADRATMRLTVCTNNVPGVEAALQAMRASQIEARYVEWSESTNDALLAGSHVVLLPTNLSGFSLSKTHNRCGDALASGCLVLASPQGPYRGIGGAVFDDPEALAAAIGRITPEGVRQAIDESYRTLHARHSLRSDVARLRTTLANLRGAAGPTGHGRVPTVLIASRIKAEVPKLARTLGHLIGGFANGPLALNYDFRLEDLESFEGPVTVTLSERARQVLDTLLLQDVDVDLDDYGSYTECRIREWKFRLYRGPHRVVVREGLPAGSLAALARVQALPRRPGSSGLSAWFDAHVDVLTRILHRLGFGRIHLAAEDEGGWQAFADNADPELAAMSARLAERWRRFQGRELSWGRPAEAAA